jgi:hypothetical protein
MLLVLPRWASKDIQNLCDKVLEPDEQSTKTPRAQQQNKTKKKDRVEVKQCISVQPDVFFQIIDSFLECSVFDLRFVFIRMFVYMLVLFLQ